MNKVVRTLLFSLAIMLMSGLFSGCFLFKKGDKCDTCPDFGKAMEYNNQDLIRQGCLES